MTASAEPLTPTSTSRRMPAWRLVLLPLLISGGTGAVLIALTDRRAFWPDLGAGLLLWAVAAVLARPFAPPLLGPIFFYDLRAAARRGRFVIVRLVYVAALMVILLLLHAEWFGQGGGLPDLFATERLSPSQVSAFNDSFFQKFMAVQYLVVVLLTPGLTAGAVAEEKERRTLEHLLATDLRGHEIVLGKLAGRLTYLAMILLAGLPVLSLMQFLGGVAPMMLTAGFVATAVTMLSLAALSILNSVYATKARTAIALSYALAALYFGATTGSLWLWTPGTMPAWAEWVCAGNAYVALKELQASIRLTPGAGRALVSGLPGILLGYVLFHLTVMVLCLVASLVGLRLWARWQASGRARKAFVIALTQRRLPRVSARPMMWKELHAEPLIRLGEAAQIIITTGVAMTLIVAALALIAVVAENLVFGHLPERMNTTVRLMGTALASLMVLGAAVRAAGAISGERDRRTMDTLLTTPVENDSIVWAKWWGSVLGVRKAGYCLLVLWLVGAATGGLSVAALPLLIVALFVYLGFAASLGLWFSLRCRTTLRATVWTVALLLVVGGGHWLLTLFCCSPLASLGGFATPMSDAAGVVTHVQTYTLTPPLTMAVLAFWDQDIAGADGHIYGQAGDRYYGSGPMGWIAFSLLGVALYGMVAVALLLRTRGRFTAVTGRLPLPGVRSVGALPRKRGILKLCLLLLFDGFP